MKTVVLNAYFDIYAEEDHNAVLKDLGMIPMLSESVPQYRAMVQTEEAMR